MDGATYPVVDVTPSSTEAGSRSFDTAEKVVAGVVLFGLWAATVGLLAGLAPKFVAIYAELGAELPLGTQILVRLSGMFGNPLGVAASFFMTVGLTVAYAFVPFRGPRRVVLAAVAVLGGLLLAGAVAALYQPLFQIGKAIR